MISKYKLNICDLTFILKKFKFDAMIKFDIFLKMT